MSAEFFTQNAKALRPFLMIWLSQIFTLFLIAVCGTGLAKETGINYVLL